MNYDKNFLITEIDRTKGAAKDHEKRAIEAISVFLNAIHGHEHDPYYIRLMMREALEEIDQQLTYKSIWDARLNALKDVRAFIKNMTDDQDDVKAIEEPKEGVRYYSQLCGHRYWYYTGMKINMQGYPDWGKVTRYRFRDVCGHTEDYTIETFAECFEER